MTVVAVFAAIAMAAGAACALDGAVKMTVREGVGAYLTDGKDMTLYWFKKDAAGKSACAGACAEKWPVYYAATVKAPDGIGARTSVLSTGKTARSRRRSGVIPFITGRATRKPGRRKATASTSSRPFIDPANFPPK